MKRFLKPMVAALAILAAGTAIAEPMEVDAPVVFVAVDSVEVGGHVLFVKGVVEGQATASEWMVTFSASATADIDGADLQACHRAALVAMSKPGAYRLKLSQEYGWAARCALSRATP
jgi:hypothetical protein